MLFRYMCAGGGKSKPATRRIVKCAYLLSVCAVILATGCDESKTVDTRSAVCVDVDCGEHGKCLVSMQDEPVCLCDSGYEISSANALECVASETKPVTNACKDVKCGGHGKCLVSTQDEPVCLCDSGYEISSANALECVASETKPVANACEGVTCSDHGSCLLTTDGKAVCLCTSGYHLANDNMTMCEADAVLTNPCETVNCGGEGNCMVTSDNAAVCLCNPGYHVTADNLTQCIEDDKPVNPCTDKTCNDKGICVVIADNTPVCICQAGYHNNSEDALVCDQDEQPADPCDSVECGEGTCLVTAKNTAACLCNPGYHVTVEAPDKCIKDASPCDSMQCGEYGVCVTDGDKASCVCNAEKHLVNIGKTCACDPGKHLVSDGDNCVCDAENLYFGVPDSCVYCAGEHMILVDNRCTCDNGSFMVGNACKLVAAITVGEKIKFGRYKQSNDTDLENIEWTVLDKKEDKLLLLSDYILDTKKYNEKYEDITWEKSTIRTWLNNSFINTAFSESEAGHIVESALPSPVNSSYPSVPAGNATNDKVFLLSLDDISTYFPGANDTRIAYTTVYAKNQGTSSILPCKEIKSGVKYCAASWLLRSPGKFANSPSDIYISGSIDTIGYPCTSAGFGIRPAIWVK